MNSALWKVGGSGTLTQVVPVESPGSRAEGANWERGLTTESGPAAPRLGMCPLLRVGEELGGGRVAHGFSIGVRTRFPHSVQDPS